MMQPYLFNDFIYKNWEHVKDRPFLKHGVTPESNLSDFRSILHNLGIKTTPKMLDWRIYALLMFSIVSRRRLKVSPGWLPQYIDITTIEECFSLWPAIKDGDDIPKTMYNLRLCIEDKKLDIMSKFSLLLRCKYEIHHDPKMPTYVPVYLSLYTKVLKTPAILNKVVTNNRAWGVLSTIHYFPLTLALVEYDGFEDEFNWFACSFLILSKLLNESR